MNLQQTSATMERVESSVGVQGASHAIGSFRMKYFSSTALLARLGRHHGRTPVATGAAAAAATGAYYIQ